MKVISLDPAVTEILFALGLDEEIVGVTSKCDYPNKAKGKPKFEDIKEMKKILPTHIITSDKKLFPKLKTFSQVLLYNPITLSDVYVGISDVATHVGKDASELIQTMQLTMAKAVMSLPESKPNVYLENNLPPTVAGLWIPEIITLAGGTPMLEGGKKDKKVSAPMVHKFNPQFIILASKAEDIDDRQWDVKASIINIDHGLVRAGPRLLDLHSQLTKLLHKQKDSFDGAMDILDEYYENTQPMDPWKEIADECCSQGHPGQHTHESGERKPWLPKLKK